MKIPYRVAPHIHSTTSNRTIMADMMLVLASIYVFAYFNYGLRALALCLCSVATCFALDTLGNILRKQRQVLPDLSTIVTGMMIPLLLPANISYTIIIITAIFAIGVIKLPFGGVGQNIFNPTAGGIAFAIVCFSDEVFTYSPNVVELPVLQDELVYNAYNSLAYTMAVGGVPSAAIADVFMGDVPGPMGTTNIVVLLCCALYLCVRKVINILQPLCTVTAVAVIAWFFPRVAVAPEHSLWLEIMAMPTIFIAVLLATDPVTTPSRTLSKCIYGVIMGIMIMIFRFFGEYEFTGVFVILLMNSCTPVFEAVGENISRVIRRGMLATERNYKQATFEQEEID